jgi:3'-phosphoadenosine 5'-phosphosulfate sulfotransferase (PAPS reductase)/FAD synthetase
VTSPFKIEGPAVISFSGGRTSGLMLRLILDAHDGRLPDDVHVLFANTGKEREETLDFVADVERHWNVRIIWAERRVTGTRPLKNGKTRLVIRAQEVDYASAARKGEPFVTLIRNRNFLPNPVSRFCTQELKIRVMRQWMLMRSYTRWTNVVGLRADEPHRVLKQRASRERTRWEVVHPLYEAGITKDDVAAFWADQSFDLRLQPWEGNCDLCFLKGLSRKLRIIRDRPDLADWWRERERELVGVLKPTAARFRKDQPSYDQMLRMVEQQPLLPGSTDVPDLVEDDSIDCFCTN